MDELYQQLFKTIHKANGNTAHSIDPVTTRNTAQTILKGVHKGFGGNLGSLKYNTPDFDKLMHLERNVYQFSGAKNWQMLKELTRATKDGDQIVPFKEFKNKAITIVEEYNGRNLRAEYNAAIAGAQMASKWVAFEKTPGALLEYRTQEDARVREEHQKLNRITRPVDDNFWKTYYPPNGWNCRCTVVRLNEGTQSTDKLTNRAMADVTPQKGFTANLAQEGFVFPKNSAYYIGIPEVVNKEVSTILLKENQGKVLDRLVKGKVEVYRKELPAPIIFNAKGVKEAFNQPFDGRDFKSLALLRIDEILLGARYEGFNNYKLDPMTVRNHIYSITINAKKCWAIIKERKTGELFFYSVSDSKGVLNNIITKIG